MDEKNCPCGWKIFPHGKWKKAGNKCKFWIFQNVEPMKKTKGVQLGNIMKLLVHTTIVEKKLHFAIIWLSKL